MGCHDQEVAPRQPAHIEGTPPDFRVIERDSEQVQKNAECLARQAPNGEASSYIDVGRPQPFVQF